MIAGDPSVTGRGRPGHEVEPPTMPRLPVTELRPMTTRQRRELQGYVARSIALVRALLFLAAVAVVGTVSASLAWQLPALRAGPWWLLPTLGFGAWLFRVSGRWTGGTEFRRQVRRDLADGVVAVRRVRAVDAIEVEEAEDEGPAYFIQTEDDRTLYLAFQELARSKSRGFPWTEFELIEAPHSGVFFSIRKVGEKLVPSRVRAPLTREEARKLGGFDERYRVLDVDFSSLKQGY